MNLNPLSTVYATKRRRRSNKSLRPAPKEGNSQAKSNPSKRHRERLNGELDHLASLLPFESNILSKLDRLSILRLAVAFLRTKTYFQVAMRHEKDELNDMHYRRDFLTYDNHMLNGDTFLQALNGFLMILDCNGELFFATHSIETYLGFHQSDVIHQSVYELVHSEDREELQRQLMWNSYVEDSSSSSGVSLQDILSSPEGSNVLDRSFTVRFRCLLDNTSGFLRLDIRGRIKVLHGQNKKTEDPPLALFCLCTPFGPPSLLEIPQKEVMFKSKHKLDFTFVSIDQKGKDMLQYAENEMSDIGGYDLVHYDDLSYVASAHQELLKTGASGMIAYRLQTKEHKWQWLQTSSRLVYKNSKPDFIISTHRPLMDEEGKDLLGKRTMDFKVTYLDAGLTSAYYSDSEISNGAVTINGALNNGGGSNSSVPPTKIAKRYKTHLREFLSSCRGKRKNSPNSGGGGSNNNSTNNNNTAPGGLGSDVYVDPYSNAYSPGNTSAANAAAAMNHHHHYADYVQPSAYPSIYSAASVDNRYFSPEYLASYRSLTTYYPEYAAANAAQYIAGNSYLASDPTRSSLASLQYDQFNRYFDEKDCKYNFSSPSALPLENNNSTPSNENRSGHVEEQDKVSKDSSSSSSNLPLEPTTTTANNNVNKQKLIKEVKCEPLSNSIAYDYSGAKDTSGSWQ
uniref:Aryl hydrocarbon receptor n=1 Tax=Lepeophtheirus salmonis TaxID=72036 RepID=A0A0K2TSE0_LEPSM